MSCRSRLSPGPACGTIIHATRPRAFPRRVTSLGEGTLSVQQIYRKYQDLFLRAQAETEQQGAGIWALSPSPGPNGSATKRSPSPGPSSPDGCSPCYPGVCIPPPPPDLNCPDVLPYCRFAVSCDPHGFDCDGDGIGCEKCP